MKNKDKNTRIGLLGLGNMGKNHLRNLSMIKQVELAFIYDIDKKLMDQTAEQYSVKAADNLEQELENVDAVIIATPTHTHFNYIQLASDYVKYIFVEKPLTHSISTTIDVIRFAEENDIKIQVGFIERYNSALAALENVIRNSNKVINIDFTRTNKLSSRITDIDVVLDMMIHDIDLALFLNGKPKIINAHGYVNNNIIEYARAIITHENGRFSNIIASRITEKKIRQINVTCEDMYIDCNLMSKQVLVNKQTTQQYLNNVSISSKEETILVGLQEGLLLELIDFFKLCNNESIIVPDASDALKAIEVACKIQEIIMD